MTIAQGRKEEKMDDLISRNSAYATALAMYVRCDTGNIEDYRDLMCESILALPPAHPEIIRCADCKSGRPYKHTKEYVACEVDVEPVDRDKDFFCAYGKRRGGTGMIPDEDCYLMWQYCHDPNDIDKAIKEHDEDWEGLESLHQIISITYDTNHGCYVVFWIAHKGEQDG